VVGRNGRAVGLSCQWRTRTAWSFVWGHTK
jgi:hypothetical protein